MKWVLAVFVLALVACGGDDRPSLLGDGSVPGDSGGPLADGSTGTDAGTPDAGPLDRPEDYPADPFADLEAQASAPDVFLGTSRYGDGMALFLVWAPPGYTRDRTWPLVVSLHGGGDRTDTTMSLAQGIGDLRSFPSSAGGDQFIWMAPVVRLSGSFHAWAVEENALDIIDGIHEVSTLFRVDDARVYFTGTSMGGGGVATLSFVVPQAFAAYAPVVGYYFNDVIDAPDLSGVSYRVLAGELDRPPMQPFDRLGLAREFVGLAEGGGATVDLVEMPGVGHSYPFDEIGRTNGFFAAHALDEPTDWAATREAADAILPLFRR